MRALDPNQFGLAKSTLAGRRDRIENIQREDFKPLEQKRSKRGQRSELAIHFDSLDALSGSHEDVCGRHPLRLAYALSGSYEGV
ncbi:MAG: hypothetical protein EOP35_11390 [Rubrivivax sp.]|nr:MAG: hypothetical protein EOP35_11390 [Rubrivivax sp.]